MQTNHIKNVKIEIIKKKLWLNVIKVRPFAGKLSASNQNRQQMYSACYCNRSSSRNIKCHAIIIKHLNPANVILSYED